MLRFRSAKSTQSWQKRSCSLARSRIVDFHSIDPGSKALAGSKNLPAEPSIPAGAFYFFQSIRNGPVPPIYRESVCPSAKPPKRQRHGYPGVLKQLFKAVFPALPAVRQAIVRRLTSGRLCMDARMTAPFIEPQFDAHAPAYRFV